MQLMYSKALYAVRCVADFIMLLGLPWRGTANVAVVAQQQAAAAR